MDAAAVGLRGASRVAVGLVGAVATETMLTGSVTVLTSGSETGPVAGCHYWLVAGSDKVAGWWAEPFTIVQRWQR